VGGNGVPWTPHKTGQVKKRDGKRFKTLKRIPIYGTLKRFWKLEPTTKSGLTIVWKEGGQKGKGEVNTVKKDAVG